jgi:anti-sigma factor RsiW
MTDDEFFERLHGDAVPLRYEPDPFALARIRARVRERLTRPTVAGLLARWFRPLAATLAAIALAAVIGVAAIDRTDSTNSLGETSVEIVMAGDSYSVGH